MLRLFLPKLDAWNEKTNQFEEVGGFDGPIDLEHSLFTIAGWESKWKKPFAKAAGLTREELFSYVTDFMCQTPEVPKSAWTSLNRELTKQIVDYIDDSHTATTISRKNAAFKTKTGKSETVTSELIYYYMTQFNIPFECEHWHLNRLMTLIDICAIKNSPPKKLSKQEAAAMRNAQNTKMRQKLGSRG